MNISITNLCNRRCDYCFQKTWYLSNKTHIEDSTIEMSVDQYAELLTWSNVLHIKLMGGEPLLHSKIKQLIEVAYYQGKNVTLISNISVEPKIIENIFSDKTCECIKSILVNSDYPTSQKDLFEKNFEYIVSQTRSDVSISSTLLQNHDDIMESAERISRLVKIYTRYRPIETLCVRLSPYCPKPGEHYKEYDYSTELAEYFNILWSNGPVEAHFDCTVLDSEINPQAAEAYQKAGINVGKSRCDGHNGMPLDFLVDGSVVWCSSCNYIKVDNYKDYRNIREVELALIKKWHDYYHTLGIDPMPESFCLAKAVCKNEVPIKMFK